MNVVENNKLIAEFMGRCGKHNKNLWTFKGVAALLEDDIWYYLSEAKFHTSWDWLIPVINKIYQSDAYYKYKNEVSSQFHDGSIEINTAFIEITYKGVVEFIQWYNENIKS